MTPNTPCVRWFADLSRDDVAIVGGKNASLGEMIQPLQDEGIRVPDGLAITVAAYQAFLAANDLGAVIQERLASVHQGSNSLARAGAALRRLVQQAPFPDDINTAIRQAYHALSQRYDTDTVAVVVINAGRGLGEQVVQGAITPDQYIVFKPLLSNPTLRPILEKTRGSQDTIQRQRPYEGPSPINSGTPPPETPSFVLEDADLIQLARWACAIEAHYGTPIDIEWARDGNTGEIAIVQARPETVHTHKALGAWHTYTLEETGHCLLTGLSVGDAIAVGPVYRLSSPAQIDQFPDGAILVTRMTDPDWVPIMQRAQGIMTDSGGRTSHAAIVNRELGAPAIVGTGEATAVLRSGQSVTLSCAEGEEGFVYEGFLDFARGEVPLDTLPQTQTRLMLNLASPTAAFRWWRLPCAGIGLARMEFIISHLIKIHPMALVHFDAIRDPAVRQQIQHLTRGYSTKTAYFVEHLARGIGKLAASQYPAPVIVRMSDFKTNEYAGLLGGKDFEPLEENPMLGFQGLRRGQDGLQVYVMCELPANVVLAQLTLGVDRSASELAHLFDERNAAVTTIMRHLIQAAHAAGRPVGICGQAPSDYPEFAAFLVASGIDTISLNPDSVIPIIHSVALAERTREGGGGEAYAR